MSDTTGTPSTEDLRQDLEHAKEQAAHVAESAREHGRDRLDTAKEHMADRAERIADAVEATADELESSGNGAVSGYGRSLASMMRQLAGGLRERDVQEFASELATFARRNPGAFLAGSVALGFGLSRFLRAGSQRASSEEYEDFGQDDDFASDDEEWAGEDRAAFGGESPERSAEDVAGGETPQGFGATSGAERPDPLGEHRERSGGRVEPSWPPGPTLREAPASDRTETPGDRP